MGILIALVVACAIFYLQWWYYKEHWKKKLQVSLQFLEKDAAPGQVCHLKEIITNTKAMPLPTLQVKFRTDKMFDFEEKQNASITDYYYRDDVFSVSGNKRVTRTLAFVPRRRGYFTIDTLDLIAWDFFLKDKYLNQVENDTVLYVYPRNLSVVDLEEVFQRMIGEILAKRNTIEDPFAFRGIRGYQPFDSMRKINWKSSARHGNLLVNTYDSTFSQEMLIFLNVNNKSYGMTRELQEHAIAIVSTVSAYFINAGVAVSIETNGKDIVSNESVRNQAGSNKKHLQTINRRLARIDLEKESVPFVPLIQNICNRNAEGACYLFVTAEISEEFLLYYYQLQKRGCHAFVIVPQEKSVKTDIPSEMIRWEVE